MTLAGAVWTLVCDEEIDRAAAQLHQRVVGLAVDGRLAGQLFDATEEADAQASGVEHGGIGHEDRIDRELIRRLAEDVQAVIRSGQFTVEYVGELEEGVPGPEDELLQQVYERWAMTLGAYEAGDL